MFQDQIPKIDLHHHFDGDYNIALLYETAKERKLPQANCSMEDFTKQARVSKDCNHLTDFLRTFEFFYDIAKDRNFIEKSCALLAAKQARENIVYTETRFDPHLLVCNDLSAEEAVLLITETLSREARQNSIEIKVILSLMRGSPLDQLKENIRFFEMHHNIVGIDLAGDEFHIPYPEAAYLYKDASTRGIPVTIHAGEARGAESIHKALNDFGAIRIGHGVNAVADKSLMKKLKDRQIFLEICVTSNLQTGTVLHLNQHPLRELFDAEVPVTLNTDDPSVSGINLAGEINLIMQEMHFLPSEILQLQKNSVQAAFCDLQAKDKLLAKINQFELEFYSKKS